MSTMCAGRLSYSPTALRMAGAFEPLLDGGRDRLRSCACSVLVENGDSVPPSDAPPYKYPPQTSLKAQKQAGARVPLIPTPHRVSDSYVHVANTSRRPRHAARNDSARGRPVPAPTRLHPRAGGLLHAPMVSVVSIEESASVDEIHVDAGSVSVRSNSGEQNGQNGHNGHHRV